MHAKESRPSRHSSRLSKDRAVGVDATTLEVAAACLRHSEVVQELNNQVGIEDCGGDNGGVNARSGTGDR